MSLTKATNSMIKGAFYNVLDYGAVPDLSIDSTASIQAAIDAATATGGTVFIPHGYYKVSSTLNVGLPFYNNNDVSFIVERTAPISDASDVSNQNTSNKTANTALSKIDLVGEAGTYIVADFTASVKTPVIAYNLDNDSFDNTGAIRNLSVISVNSVSSGKYDPTAVIVSNNLVGVYAGRGCSVSEKLMFAGLDVGFLSQRAYWTTHRNMKAYHCGQGFNISAHNQALAQDLNAHTCGTGYKYDGQNGSLKSFGTENCDIDCWILSADCCDIGPAYLEDVRTSGGSGNQSMRLGYSTGNTQITHTKFISILILNVLGTAKKGWRLWSVADSVLETCRAYGSGYDIDTVSYGSTSSCDFIVDDDKWSNDAILKGEWTPVIADSDANQFTADTVVGHWTKVGNQVTAIFTISWTSIGSATSSGLVISGLPFAVADITGLRQSASLGYVSGVDTVSGTKEVTAFALYSGTPVGKILSFFHIDDNANATAIAANTCSATGEISGTITYIST